MRKKITSRLIKKKNFLKYVYNDSYWIDSSWDHIFPLQKYRLIYERLIQLGIKSEDILISKPALDEDILRVHSRKYFNKLNSGKLSSEEAGFLELPFSQFVYDCFKLFSGGSIQAAEASLEHGLAIHIGGGFHHAFSDHGEGFCVINDIAIAIKKLCFDNKIKKAMIVDCDVHQGNGTAKIFEKNPSIFTFSIHQMDIYPAKKAQSSLDCGLWSGDGDKQYLDVLNANFPRLYDEFNPEIVCYVAGADPFANDMLGGLDLSFKGLEERDYIVMEEARKRGIPVFVLLAGGYASDVDDIVRVHINTIKVAQKINQKYFK